MPATQVIYFQEKDGKSPVREWLSDLASRDKKAFASCVARIRLLARSGHELKRPHAAPLDSGIHELRTRIGGVNYRLLYFFHGRNIAILANACTKKGKVPTVEISRALERMATFVADPESHTYTEEQE